MAELGRVKPHASNTEQENITEWRVPVIVMSHDGEVSYKITAIYEDEGCLCIDIEVPKE